MMEANLQFGYRCTRCNSTTALGIGGGDVCSKCGGKLVPDTSPTASASLANFHCSKCGYSSRLIIGGGAITACPDCGHPVE